MNRSPTAWNAPALLGWLRSPSTIAMGGAGVAVGTTMYNAVQLIGSQLLMAPDLALATDVAAAGLSVGAGLLMLLGSDMYNAMRKTPGGGSTHLLSEANIRKAIRNTRRAMVYGGRARSASGSE